jgi:hypothetical protein
MPAQPPSHFFFGSPEINPVIFGIFLVALTEFMIWQHTVSEVFILSQSRVPLGWPTCFVAIAPQEKNKTSRSSSE